MTREKLIQRLRRYARKQNIAFEVETKKGKGSHITIFVGDKFTTVQHSLNPGRIERALKQLGVDPADL